MLAFKELNFIDLFSGVGGLSYNLRHKGLNCVFSCDFDKFVNETYYLNYEEQSYGDITKINPSLIPNHQILLAGFPCQAFSIAGLRKGFADERGALFLNILQILQAKQPEYFILENVKGLITHEKGQTLKFILQQLENRNYFVKWKVLNTADFGIPQNRERIYIIGFKNKQLYEDYRFPKAQHFQYNLNNFIDLASKNLSEKYFYKDNKYFDMLKESYEEQYTFYQIRRKYIRVNKKNICPTLTANMGTGGHNVPIIYTKRGFRKLTPRECFNLQGFPLSFKLPKLSDTRLYKQVGNSVSINVIEKITNCLEKVINDHR